MPENKMTGEHCHFCGQPRWTDDEPYKVTVADVLVHGYAKIDSIFRRGGCPGKAASNRAPGYSRCAASEREGQMGVRVDLGAGTNWKRMIWVGVR